MRNRDDDRGRDDDLHTGYTKERMSGGVIALIVVAVLLLLFILQNGEEGTIDFLFWDVTMRTWMALLIAAVLGFAAGYLVARMGRRRRSED
jgi:uncharacterized integral membrane protein